MGAIPKGGTMNAITATATTPEFVSYDSIYHGQSGAVAWELLYDQCAAGSDSPAEWISGHCALMTVDRPANFGDLDESPDGFDFFAARYCWVNKQEGGLCTPEIAFERHYARKGWEVGVFTLHGCSQGDWHVLAVAVEPGYGSAEFLAHEMQDWLFGDVYEAHFYGLFDFGGDLEWVHVESVGDIYLTDMTQDEITACMADECAGVSLPDECDTWRKAYELGKLAA